MSFIILKENVILISLNQEQNIFLFISPAQSPSLLTLYVGTADPLAFANLLKYLPFLPVKGRLWFL